MCFLLPPSLQKKNMKTIFLFLSIIVANGLLFINLYTSIVDARSWGSDIPNSVAAAREYFKAANPGDFFRMFSPVNQILGLLVLILFWKASPSIRLCLGAAFLLYLAADAMTFAYFYPRNDLLFKTAPLTDTELLQRTVAEWSGMNWVRSLIVAAGVFFSCLSMYKIFGAR